MEDELLDDRLDRLFGETVRHIADGYYSGAADGLAEIADYFARAGLGMQSFLNMRRHLIESAREKTQCAVMAEEHLLIAERALKARRKENL